MVAAVIVTLGAAGCSSAESALPGNDDTTSESDAGQNEGRCVNNNDPVLYDTSVSTMGYVGMTPSEMAAAIAESTADSAADWYSTTSMQLTDQGLRTLKSSVDAVVMENPNKSTYDFTMRASDPNDPTTHAWCLSAN